MNVKLVISEFQFIILFCNGVKDVNLGLLLLLWVFHALRHMHEPKQVHKVSEFPEKITFTLACKYWHVCWLLFEKFNEACNWKHVMLVSQTTGLAYYGNLTTLISLTVSCILKMASLCKCLTDWCFFPNNFCV